MDQLFNQILGTSKKKLIIEITDFVLLKRLNILVSNEVKKPEVRTNDFNVIETNIADHQLKIDGFFTNPNGGVTMSIKLRPNSILRFSRTDCMIYLGEESEKHSIDVNSNKQESFLFTDSGYIKIEE